MGSMWKGRRKMPPRSLTPSGKAGNSLGKGILVSWGPSPGARLREHDRDGAAFFPLALPLVCCHSREAKRHQEKLPYPSVRTAAVGQGLMALNQPVPSGPLPESSLFSNPGPQTSGELQVGALRAQEKPRLITLGSHLLWRAPPFVWLLTDPICPYSRQSQGSSGQTTAHLPDTCNSR